MNNYDEKMQALEVLKGACEAVTGAMNAIEDFAAAHGMRVRLEKQPRHVTIPELAEMVAGETEMKPECVFTAIACAFDLIRDLDLIVDAEDEDDDEE